MSSTLPSTAALAFNPTHGAHAAKDFTLPKAAGLSPHGGRLILQGEEFPIGKVHADQVAELHAAGWIKFGPALERTQKRAAARREAMKAEAAKKAVPVTKPVPSPSKLEARAAR